MSKEPRAEASAEISPRTREIALLVAFVVIAATGIFTVVIPALTNDPARDEARPGRNQPANAAAATATKQQNPSQSP